MKYRENGAICHHFALLIDGNFSMRRIATSTENCSPPTGEDYIGTRCYSFLWGRDEPCPVCPLLTRSDDSPNTVFSHFYRGVNRAVEDLSTESLIILPSKDFSALVLIEPLMAVFRDEKDTLFFSCLHPGNGEGDGGGKGNNSKDLHMIEYLEDLFYRQQYVPLISGFKLTPTEEKVVMYIFQKIPSKEIAYRMSISKKAVDFHRSNIRRKLNIVGKKISITTFLMNEDQEGIT